jgi:hypothetical protein
MKIEFEGFIEAITPFMEANGFASKKEKYENQIGFYKPLREGSKDQYFFRFESSSLPVSLFAVYGVRFHKMLKYMGEVVPHYQYKEDTLHFSEMTYQKMLTSKEEMEDALNHYKTLYANCAIPFYRQNSTLNGVLETLRCTNEYQSPYMPKETGRYFTNYNARDLELFLTKILKPDEFELRVAYYKNAFANRINSVINGLKEPVVQKEFERYKGREDILLNNIPINDKEIDDLVEKINSIDIEQARKELISSAGPQTNRPNNP